DRSVGDGRSGNVGSLSTDLSNLVAWAHTHGAICSQIPALEILQDVGRPGCESSVLWMCGLGHAYYWPCGKLDLRREENEAVERRKTLTFSEASSREANSGVKRFRMAPSSEGPKAGVVSTGAHSRSPGVTQQKGDTISVLYDEPPRRENRKKSSTKPCVAAEQRWSASGGEVQIYRHKVKTESKDLQVIPGGRPRASVGDDQGDRINQNILSESPVKGVAAAVDVPRRQQAASNKTPTTQTAGAAAKAQPESPACMTFFEFDARFDVQEQLSLSPAEPGTSGMGFGVPVEKQDNKKYRNSRDIKVFKDWLVSHCPSETLEIHRLPPEQLDNYLALFYSSAKRQDGRDFSANSLSFFQSYIDRYLKDHNYEYSVAKGSEFRMSQEVLKLKVQEAAQKEMEGKWSALENLTDDGVERLREKRLLSKNHPQGLLHLMFTNLVRGFGARTHRQHHGLLWGAEQGAPRLLAKPGNPESCPIVEYKEYARRRPPDMLHHDDPLYLAPKPLCSVWDEVWYCRKALAGTKMENILKVIIQQGKVSGNRSKK
ncbi:PREDICTED: uncharacterized protein LOC104275846, partial [Apaloderma vittatum]|uniref:uncharacterized protein LOC104275846 n=1 Tax=Apaloderma vittatum TaxID=57397 RepID=UPI000521CE29